MSDSSREQELVTETVTEATQVSEIEQTPDPQSTRPTEASAPTAPEPTGDSTTPPTNVQEATRPDIAIGDHVYNWQRIIGIPAFHHHAIVLDVVYHDDAWFLVLADFSNQPMSTVPKSGSSLSNKGHMRVYEVAPPGWHRVRYGAPFWQRHLSSGGTCTAAHSDPPGIVRARVDFLIHHTDLLPDYHVTQCNCECVAVWCSTGTWATLQATSWLVALRAGQAKSALTLASVAASTTVTVPAAGLWGWMGYTTQASLVATQPYLIPAIAGYGLVTVGIPLMLLKRSERQWKEWTMRLNDAFWSDAIDRPDVFAEAIMHWSDG